MGDGVEPSAKALKRIERRTPLNNGKEWTLLIVRDPTVTILDQFQPDITVIREGEALYGRRIARVFSAVQPKQKYKTWWQELVSRAKDPTIHWLG